MNRVSTLGIALFVAMVGMALMSSSASACHLFHRHYGGCGGHGCGHRVASHDCGGGGCGHHGGGCNGGGCGHHGGGCGHHGGCGGCNGCNGGGYQNGEVIQEQGGVKGTEGSDVPEAPPAAEPTEEEAKETSIRSNRIFRTASFRR